MAAILHISDVHRTRDEQVTNAEVLQWLCADLEEHSNEDIPAPDLVVVSGDLAQSAEPSQYEETSEFLSELCKRLDLPLSRLVLVPGNHDVHWATCEDNLRARRSPRTEVEKTLAFDADGRTFTYESEEAFQARLANFRAFYSTLLGSEYPEDRRAAFTSHAFPELGLRLVGLSSVDKVDRDRPAAGFCPEAIRLATQTVKEDALLPVAVWHHDLDWERGQNDGLPADDLRLLSTGPFRLGLCGHTHRPANNNVCYLQGYSLPVVAAGSLCAGPEQRPESRGRSYNIVRIDEGSARVWVRTKDERGKKWRDLCEFGSPQARRSWFDVPLAGDATSSSPKSDPSTRQPGVLRSPNPFSNANAKQSQRSRVIRDYIWNLDTRRRRRADRATTDCRRNSGVRKNCTSLYSDARITTQSA